MFSLRQQKFMIELLKNRSMRPKDDYKKNIFSCTSDFNSQVKELLKKEYIKKIKEGYKNVRYELTVKGKNVSVLFADFENLITDDIDDFIIIQIVGNKKFDLLKPYAEYRIKPNGH